jgi:hypothetical protein
MDYPGAETPAAQPAERAKLNTAIQAIIPSPTRLTGELLRITNLLFYVLARGPPVSLQLAL